MNYHKTFRIISVAVFFLIVLATIFIYMNHIEVTLDLNESLETTDELNNPYQGFYRLRGYMLNDNDKPLARISDEISWDTEYRLALLEINLKNYSESPISDYALNQLDTIFTMWASSNNKQLIVRFLYDWDGVATKTEPKDISTIMLHMEQVAPIVNKHAKDIYILQGIFLGNQGEMQGSAHLSEGNMKILQNHWANVTDSSIYLAVRTPAHWRLFTNQLFFPEKFETEGYLMSRLGLYNDGMLGSMYDLGTYSNISRKDTVNPFSKGTRKEELEFQNKLCLHVPNGGEVVLDNPFNDLDNAINDLNTMHVSYLNMAHDASVINKWKQTTYQGDSCFNGLSGLDYIRAHLGYRYKIGESKVIFESGFDQTAIYRLSIDNVGFCNTLKDFTATLTLVNQDNAKQTSYVSNADFTSLLSGDTLDCDFELPVRNLHVGKYKAFLKIKSDESGEEIKLATSLPHDENGYELGLITIKH